MSRQCPRRDRLRQRLIDKREAKVDTTGTSPFYYHGKRITETYAQELMAQGKRLQANMRLGTIRIEAGRYGVTFHNQRLQGNCQTELLQPAREAAAARVKSNSQTIQTRSSVVCDSNASSGTLKPALVCVCVGPSIRRKRRGPKRRTLQSNCWRVSAAKMLYPNKKRDGVFRHVQ